MPDLTLASDGTLWRGDSLFDAWERRWVAGRAPGDAAPASLIEAATAVMHGPRVRRIPVGVIGPREPEGRQAEVAQALGRALGELGVQMACGGRGGVMEAACRGNLEAGGLPIGLLPDEEWESANPYVAIPLATGIGTARNAVLARACTALVAVGGGYGTLSEIAYGLHWDRLVLAMEGAPEVKGAIRCASLPEVLERLARHVLALPQAS
ncbi:TIGR00725 family protein [Afifella sp. IM 167]|uniref:TIGR00725 family protein n=1 Tax=Afifella sp. IM 167 TaxID=2033586 RepID=UPI001CCEEB7D|nr:TIGR00725 family protein [Afifella sp. IM 167]MBZ8133681.1 TIGR00725 family protein [Afifella sp. IM 167]